MVNILEDNDEESLTKSLRIGLGRAKLRLLQEPNFLKRKLEHFDKAKFPFFFHRLLKGTFFYLASTNSEVFQSFLHHGSADLQVQILEEIWQQDENHALFDGLLLKKSYQFAETILRNP